MLRETILTSSRSADISSRIGWTTRHGPHQGAQKSTSTGSPASSTSAWKLLSVTCGRLATGAPRSLRFGACLYTGDGTRIAVPGCSNTLLHKMKYWKPSRVHGRPPASPQPHQRDAEGRLGDDALAHLRFPDAAVVEHDRHLLDPEAGEDRPIGGLDLEGVA